MELSEKLQSLRKRQGLTQEQVADRLYVSRTAVSKWETGNGCPNLDSLKALAALYGVTVDELLSGDELITLATKENRANLERTQCLVAGLLDILALSFAFLPLAGIPEGSFVRAVSLVEYYEATGFTVGYFVLLGTLAAAGVVELVAGAFGSSRMRSRSAAASLGIQAVAIMLFAASRQPYVTVFLFIFFAVKTALLFAAHRNPVRR
ncbi:helix-turn-helix domain-containing protein [Raoultibacter phocaeensis]|uniref:helix-turn-helix domain-containing protein n=1 Tax=Raoultibacter phocaeensis TaxID=2479841 RepID=UPI00111A9006|nr:helix-turn-helix transcriptional regulator [Raoultibacter phocaeensis]